MDALLGREMNSTSPKSVWTIYRDLEHEKLREKNHELIRRLREYGDTELLIHLVEELGVISLTDYEEATFHDWPTDRQNIILGRDING